MAKQLNVDLKFNADTSQAKTAIQTLISDLNKLTNTSAISSDLPITKEIMEAQMAAKQLGQSLEKAFNTDTGKLDLTKFTQQLNSSGMSLTDYGNKLSMLGAEGDKAFLKIAQSIAATQAPLRQSSGLLANFATTLKNTARWQISSSILHGFMGTVQSAYGYAQDLNRSLNDIRIVTGQSVDQMDAFAERANRAAKALSTTTTAYTNASLIFYQQGLDDSEVQERTNVVIKMANASQQSAELTADQLTAIWNNFDDGSKSLEYYADVMTALGAATASSTSEIADGLEKFAAIADTVGLSYEYATAALATVTATTRQSADVVGTAFKTLFARIQDLELGETLDDGTTLGKYSEALAAVGINIKDTSGEIKGMNQILDEMGDKWNDLSKDTQIALAQTVAGTRQYTQLVALMDNWDYFQENLGVANTATGTLQDQADIYAESWEASKDRVRASAEEIYSSLIDDDFFIKLNDTFAKLLSGISLFIDALGGLKGVLPGIGLLLTSMFKEDMANGINNALQNFKLFTGVAQQELSQLKGEAYDAAMSLTEGFSDQLNVQALRGALESTYNLQKELSASVKQMSPEQRKVAEAALETAQNYNAMAVEIAEAAEAADRLFQKQKMANEEKRRTTMSTMEQHYDNSVGQGGRDLLASARGMSGSAASLGVDTSALDEAIQKYSQAFHQLGKGSDEAKAQAEANFKAMAEKLRAAMDEVNMGAVSASEGIAKYTANLSASAATVAQKQGQFSEIKKSIDLGEVTEESIAQLEKLSETFGTSSKGGKQLANALEEYKKAIAAANGDTAAIATAQNSFKVALSGVSIGVDEVADATARMANQTADGGKNIPVLTNEMRGMATSAAEVAINNRNAGEAIKTAGQKSQEAAANIRIATLAYQSIGSAMTGTLSAISSFAMGLNSLNSIYDTLNNNDLSTFEKTTSIMMSLSMGLPALIGGFSKLGNVLKFVVSTQKQGLTAQLASLMGIKATTKETGFLVVAKNGEVLSRHATAEAAGVEAAGIAGATVVTEIDTAKTWANIAAKMAQHWYILLIVAALAALAAAIYVAVSAYNEEAAAAKQAQGAIEECNEAQQDLQKSVEELDSAWKTYDTAVEKLKKCTRGTEEWKEALSEVNGAALDVIDSLDGLDLSAEEIKALYNTDKGYMEIDTDKLKEYKDQMVDMAEAAEYAADFSKIYATKKTDSADLLTEMRKASSTQEYMAQEGYGTVDSEGNYYGMVDEQKITDAILQNTEDWLNLSESEFSDKLKELGINVDILSSTTLNNLQSKVEELASSTAAANEKLLLIAKIKVDEELGDNYGESEKAIVSRQLAYRTNELTDAWYDYLTSNSGEKIDFGGDIGIKTSGGINQASVGDNSIYLEAVEALRAAGYNWTAFTGNAVLGDDNNRRFIFNDENGEQTKEKSAAWVAETVAAAQALAELTGNAKQAGAALSSMEDRVSESGASAIKKMISEGNINSLTEKELSKLKIDMDSDSGGDVSSDEAIAYLRNAFANTGLTGEELDSYIATMFGKESITEVGDSWSNIIAGTEEAWGNLADGFTRTVGDILNSIDTSSLSMDQVQDLGNLLTQAFTVGGSEGAKTLSDMYTKAAKQGLGDEFIDTLFDIDWTTITPQGLSKHLNDAGIAINFTDAELQNLINTMHDGADGFDSAASKYKTLNEIINTLKQGDTISAEQFEALGSGMEDYFMCMADGTYKLIGDAEAFYAAVNEQSIEGFESTIAAKTKDNSAIQNVLNHDIGSLGNTEGTNMGGHAYMGGGEWAQNTDVANTQLDFLEQAGYDPTKVQQWRDDMNAGKLDVVALTKAVNEKITALGGAAAAEEYLTQQLDINNTEIRQNKEAIASTATSLDELDQMLQDGRISMEAYKKASQGAFEKEIEVEGFDTEELNNYVDALIESGKFLEENREQAQKFALAQYRLEKGCNALIEGYDGWNEILSDNEASLKDINKIMPEVNAMLQDMMNLSDEEFALLPDNFAQDNWNLIQDVYNEVDGAYEALRAKITEEIILNIGLDQSQLTTVQDAINTFLANVDLDDIEIGTTLDQTGFAEGLQNLLDSGAVTVDQMNSILEGIGYEPVIEYEKIAVSSFDRQTQQGYIQVAGVDGSIEYVPITSDMDISGEQYVYVPKIGSSTYKGGGPAAIADAKADKKGGGGGGGGGSKPKKATPTKKSDVVDRYKEVEDKLDDIRDEADLTRSSLDRLYGAEHEAAIQRLLELEQQEIDLLKEKEQEARNYLQEDLKELKKVSAEVDVEFKFDDNNNIENYEEEMTKLYEELAEIQRKAGDEWDENEQKEIDALNEKIKKLEEAMAAYEETRELLEDINTELDAFKGKPALPLITSDTLDIYWEINDALDDIDEQIKDLERKAEGLSGEEKLKVLEEINRLEQERVAILQQQAEVNQKDIEEKRAALDELARLNGLQFEYDEETGNITNYLEQMGILQAQLDELHAKKAADGLSPAEEEAMNAIIAKMEELADLAGDYRDAVEESEDILNEIEDTLSGIVADPFVRSDFVDIFKETNDQLDDIDRKISKLQNEADKLTGEARRKKLNEIVTLERKRVEILEHQALIAKTEMEDRKRAMEEIAARQELMFEYDENQNITNYQEQLDILIDKYEKAYNEALGDDGLIDATEQAILDSISDDIDHLEEFIQAYCDAVDQLEDIEDEREEIANGGYVDMSQLDDIADELHDINQSLDDLQELLDDSSRAADRLYGEARIKQMEKNASLLQQEIDLLQQKKTAQDDIIAKEKQQLDEKTGGYIKYDEYGRITNYDSYINAREDQIREYEAALQEGGLSETEATLLQDEIDLLNEQIAAMEDYEQALEEKEDIQNQIEDAYYEWQDLNAEKLQYKLELQLDVNDRELAKIERAIKRLDGNFYSRAEALALMVGGGMNGDSKLGNYNKQLADLEAHYQEVKRQYEAGEISQAAYVEMTKELQAEIESTADAMAALQDQMDSYYKDTLAQARQELNFHISQLTHLTGILNHFKNTLTALGKSKDYEMMGTVLEGQVQALENEVKASKNAMQMWQKEADSIYQKYQQALSSGNQENADMYYNAYKEALSAANEAENKFYQQSAAWANALKALMENTLAGLAQDLENALTGGTSFDTITTQMKRASSLQEEYLTTTNKIYETTKLMRTAQQEIDKTTNSVAKQKLSQFITETKQMQNQNKLSKYELSIQQAKYDLLVAEIALEEARFAKSTVRLRRDSEGNFGYVYTADAQAIATAEQKFEDAQNKLYNIGLEGANEYTEKYQQTLAEMYDTLTSLQTKYLQGGFESEAEYNAAVLEAKEYYYEKLNQYSELYSVAINAESGTLTDTLVNNSGIVTDALTKNSRIAAEAWSTDFSDMTTKTDQWMVAVTDYLSQVQIAFADWEVESQRIANETVGTDLTTLKNKVSDIVTESDNLTAAIGDENGGVIKAIYDEITAVSGLVTEYANLNGQLTQAIQNALDLSDALQQDIDQAGQDENPPGQYAPDEENSQKPGTVVPEGTDPLPEIELPEDPDENNPGGEPPGGEPPGGEPPGGEPPPHSHSYGSWTTTKKATCTEKGQKQRTCSCGDIEYEDIDELGHNYGGWQHNEKVHWKECSRCKIKKDEDKHTPDEKGKCTVCGYQLPADADGILNVGDTVTYTGGKYYYDSYGSDPAGSRGPGKKVKVTQIITSPKKGQDYPIHVQSNDSAYGWLKKSQLEGFDTGGYTGEWGSFGKLAWLHEKELVLNKEDTENFLTSLELLDGILSTIDLYAMNSQFNSTLNSPYIPDLGKEALEQMVNIEASFPNATDKHEIEEAFKDLVNLASQYANRK